MAFIRQEDCHVCETMTAHTNGRCNICRAKEENARVELWNSLPVNDRLTDIRKRIEKLERGPVRY